MLCYMGTRGGRDRGLSNLQSEQKSLGKQRVPSAQALAATLGAGGHKRAEWL